MTEVEKLEQQRKRQSEMKKKTTEKLAKARRAEKRKAEQAAKKRRQDKAEAFLAYCEGADRRITHTINGEKKSFQLYEYVVMLMEMDGKTLP